MTKYRKYKNKLEVFLASNKGKRVLNLFYSWGAACVILGALMEILKVPYGDIVLAVSMLVEFTVFFISGFERPQPTYKWEEVFPELDSRDNTTRTSRQNNFSKNETANNVNTPVYSSNICSEDLEKLTSAINELCTYTNRLSETSYQDYDNRTKSISELNQICELRLKSIHSHLEAMEEINTNLKQIRRQYEDAIEYSRIFREQNELMASQLKQLNAVYSRLIEALTVNMNINRGNNI